MKRAESDELRPEYRREDFGKGTRGKYFKRYHESSNVVVIDPDMAEQFPNSEAVNAALRALVRIQEREVK